ncbi:MAG: hypothetical protein A2Y28_01515 [Chlamydiae bacterium GWC2_50_10]|nr:MAG: hypothetical protein A2Z85_04815 [Chlamydiae bacterium GWA2_50_15]OGN54121.1 MAG: hypothetical protein A2Y28_01515 [Chlamydiae bacterium GWC2_50_10]OGN54689.1 MAG: hypothetical protein A2098_00735 [Chlamydiae bacterium GWF2_49_8]OGN57363.1 MAG: hypothetical protein A3D18_01890 [Chlamydiae bacterium RIFCSPHIGHO2_02_FULL_49_29]OGN64269.1 MAG: hypothetical protein A3E26_03930 [Chlamydiae bacterium RIFCSPHIGHO2_12_FULL_49_32]OGN67440.1 MAG: hypothetical protein A3I15_01835 [Chlamydiae bact
MAKEWNKEQKAKIFARAWKDETYRRKLLTNPIEALKEFGVQIPTGWNVKVIEEPAKTFYFVLPPAPANARNLTEQELTNIAAAAHKGHHGMYTK